MCTRFLLDAWMAIRPWLNSAASSNLSTGLAEQTAAAASPHKRRFLLNQSAQFRQEENPAKENQRASIRCSGARIQCLAKLKGFLHQPLRQRMRGLVPCGPFGHDQVIAGGQRHMPRPGFQQAALPDIVVG